MIFLTWNWLIKFVRLRGTRLQFWLSFLLIKLSPSTKFGSARLFYKITRNGQAFCTILNSCKNNIVEPSSSQKEAQRRESHFPFHRWTSFSFRFLPYFLVRDSFRGIVLPGIVTHALRDRSKAISKNSLWIQSNLDRKASLSYDKVIMSKISAISR